MNQILRKNIYFTGHKLNKCKINKVYSVEKFHLPKSKLLELETNCRIIFPDDFTYDTIKLKSRINYYDILPCKHIIAELKTIDYFISKNRLRLGTKITESDTGDEYIFQGNEKKNASEKQYVDCTVEYTISQTGTIDNSVQITGDLVVDGNIIIQGRIIKN